MLLCYVLLPLKNEAIMLKIMPAYFAKAYTVGEANTFHWGLSPARNLPCHRAWEGGGGGGK